LISPDPALVEGKYFPKPNDYDTEHDFYWYLSQDGSKKLPGIGGVFNAVNMDVYHYVGNNPVKLVDPDGNQSLNPVDLGFTNPFSFITQVFGSSAKSMSDAAHYSCPQIYSIGAFNSGMSAGILNAITGLDVFNANDYSMFGVADEAKGAFAKGFEIGNKGMNAVFYTNIARTVLQKTGQKITMGYIKEIMGNKQMRAEFMKGFLKAVGQGAMPSFTKTELSNRAEKAGYIIGIGISERAKYIANQKVKEYDK